MQWELAQTRGWTVDMAVPGMVRTVDILLEPELPQQVQDAAAVHKATGAALVRQAMRPNGAMLLYHLSQQHPDLLGPYLERMRIEDIGTVAAKAYELSKEDGKR